MADNKNARYINQFFGLRTAQELLPYFAGNERGAAKEVTEAFGILRAYEKRLNFGMKNSDVNVIVVGDGVRPKCGAVFAYMTKCDVVSIDPMIDLDFPPLKNVQRLHVIKDGAENWSTDCEGKDTVIILPHSHCNFDVALDVPFNYCRLAVIALPCCVKVPLFWRKKASLEYEDDEIWSPLNKIMVWKDIKKTDFSDRQRDFRRYLEKKGAKK